MAFAPIPLPSAWDVPVAAGVSAVLGQSIGKGISATASTALGGIVQNWTTNHEAQRWGIFDSDHKSIATVSRVLGMDYDNHYSVPSAPLTDGSFASFNKVKDPYTSRVMLVCDGTESGSSSVLSQLKALVGVGAASGNHVRASFLNALDTVVADTKLYSVVTPEKTYVNANIVGVRWRRDSRQGVTMLVAEVSLQEIRTTGTLLYSSTKTPAGATMMANGTVQAQDLPNVANGVVTSLQNKAQSLPLSTISSNLPS